MYNVFKLILPLLTISFVVIKLVGVVSWSWLWVLSPILVPLGIVASVVFGVALGNIASNVNRKFNSLE
jgi:hypothetical protein